MDDNNGYAVFFYPKALEALGDGIKPYLQGGKGGTHIVCREVDTGGALIEMTLDAKTSAGETVQLELMVPTSMVLMIVSARTDEAFGFGPRIAVEDARPAADDGSAAQVEVKASRKSKPAAAKPSKSKSKSAKSAKSKPTKSKPTAAPRKRSKK